MSYTYDQLVLAYTAVHDGIGPDAATQAAFQIQAVQSANGQLTDAQLLGAIVNSADGATALAVLAYQFFTGKSPTKAGVDYLVNSTTNASDLNDPYYSKFSLENRYINFAANLGVAGEGAANFAAKYSALSFSDYVASIYQTVIGASYATAAGVDAAKAIADIVSRKDAILATATSAGMIPANATAAQIDIALKAATAGYLLGEAIKADIGLYAAAANNFMVAVAQGAAIYNTDIVWTYKPQVLSASHGTGKAIDRDVSLPVPWVEPVTPPQSPAVSRSFSLTTGVDRFTGDSLDDVFNAIETTDNLLNSGDVLDGGAGQDTLNIVDIVGQFGLPAAYVTARNIETVNLRFQTTLGAPTYDMSNWTGVNRLNVTAFGGGGLILRAPSPTDVSVDMVLNDRTFVFQGGHDWTMNFTQVKGGTVQLNQVNPTGAITISLDHVGGNASGAVSFAAGGNVSVTQTASNVVGTTAYLSKVGIEGGAATTSAVIRNAAEAATDGTHAGVAWNTGGVPSVQITDVNNGTANVGVIALVDLDGYRGARIADNAMTTLKLAHGGGDVEIQNGGGATGAPTTLALSLNGVTSGTLSDQGVYTRLNVTTGVTGSTLSNINASALTALNLGGASNLTLTSTSGLTALQTVTVTGAAGITANLSGATVTAIDASASTGANTVTIDPGRATYAGGSGVDRVTVTVAGVIHKAIILGDGDDFLDASNAGGVGGGNADGGAGTADVLRLSATDAHDQLPHFTNFERLELVDLASNTVYLAGAYHHITTSGGAGAGLTGLTSGDTLVLNGPGASYGLTFQGSANLNLQLTDSSGAGVNFASAGILAPAVTTAAITVTDGQVTPNGGFMDAVTFQSNFLQTVTVGGNAGLTLTATSTALTSVDASGITLGGFAWTSGALTSAATVKGSATGANTLNFSAATQGVAYTGGTGVDTITLAAGSISKAISLGAGDDFLDATRATGTLSVTVDGGAGAGDLVRLDTATADDFASRLTGFERVELVGNTSSSVQLGAGYNHITINGSTNLALTGVESGATVVLTGVGANYSINPATLHSSLNLQLKDSSGAGVNFASTGFFVSGFETVNFAVTDGQATPNGGFMDTLTVLGSSNPKTITLSGNAGVALVASGTNPTTIDASGVTLGGFSWTAGNLASAATVKGSATGANTLDFSAISHGVAYTGGTGADIIKVGVGASTIDVGIDNSVDRVLVTRQTSLTDFITINHLAAGDQIHLPGMGVGSPDPPLTAVVTATPGSLMNQLEGYAAYADGSSAAMFFIQVGGDTYIFEDRSISAFYNPGTDVLIKLTGVTLTSANYDAANALITI